MDVHASGGIAAVFRRAWITPPTLGPVAFARRIGCGTHQAGVCLSFLHMGSLRDLGLVCRDSVAGNEVARRHKAAACDRRSFGQFGFVLPNKQFRRVGSDESVSEDSIRPDDFLYAGLAVLPQCRSGRFTVYGSDVCHACCAAETRRGIRAKRSYSGSLRCGAASEDGACPQSDVLATWSLRTQARLRG